MTYEVNILCVDGETHLSINTPSAKMALKFLRNNDHEGSSVSASVGETDTFAAYKLLEEMVAKESKHGQG
jgi:hypothetical protein